MRVVLNLTAAEWESVKKMPNGRARVLELVEAEKGGTVGASAFIAEALAAFPPLVPRDLTKMAPDLAAAVAELRADQRKRHGWPAPRSRAVD